MIGKLTKMALAGALLCGIVALASMALAEEPGQRSGVAASLNPNRYGPVQRAVPDAPRPTATRSERCDLTAHEELLVSELRVGMARLEERRLVLEAREVALRALSGQVQTQIAELREIQAQVTVALNSRDSRVRDDRQARIQQLARILKKMKPPEAARILAQQPNDIVVPTLEALGERTAGKILAQLPQERAVAIAAALIARPMPRQAEGEGQ